MRRNIILGTLAAVAFVAVGAVWLFRITARDSVPTAFPRDIVAGAPEENTPVTGTLVLAGLGKPEDFANIDVKGKFALIQRGDIPFADKATNAMAAGASGVVIYNNADGLIRDLTLEYNKLRQSNITKELLDIAGGRSD